MGRITKKIALCSALAVLLFTGCKDFWHPEGSQKESQTKTYTVTFNSNGGSNIASQTVNSGSTATRPTNPTRSGYTFDNWYSNSGLTTVYNFSASVTGNITLYAKWNTVGAGQYTVIFISNGGSDIATQIVNSGDTASRPENPTRSGYTFDNWYSNSGLTTVYNFSNPVTENITLYARWNAAGANTYTVTFNSNGGSSVAAQTVNSGDTASRPENPTRSGYIFDNWYSNSGLTTVYNFSNPVTANITLYARWNSGGSGVEEEGEIVSLANAWFAVYRFKLPAGRQWGDYEEITADYMLEDDDMFDGENSARAIRLMGNYTMADFTLWEGEGDAAGLDFAIASYNDGKNMEYVLDNNPNGGWLPLREALEAELDECPAGGEWFTLSYHIDGSRKVGEYDDANKPVDNAAGPFYFGLGLTGQDDANTFHIKNIKLVLWHY